MVKLQDKMIIRLFMLLLLLLLFSGNRDLTPTIHAVNEIKQGNLSSSSAPQSKIVTFPNMVKTVKLVQLTSAEVLKIENLLKTKNIGFQHFYKKTQSHKIAVQQLFRAQFTSQYSREISKNQVKIPATGSFELRLTKGPAFKIVDNNATDGNARIEMPPAMLKTLLYLSQNNKQNASLEVEEALYYLKDTVSSSKQSKTSNKGWFSIGTRPIPVPTEWKSSYGEDLVLNFTAKNVSSFQILWTSNSEDPAEPPFGIKEIGPEGGTVELPGIGKIDIPSGALEEKITVRLSQKKEHAKIISSVSRSSRGPSKYTYYDYISPIMKIEPMGTLLKKQARVYMLVNKTRVGDNEVSASEWVVFNEITPVNEIEPLFHEELPTSYNEPKKIYTFSYIARLINEIFGPEDAFKTERGNRSSFQTSP